MTGKESKQLEKRIAALEKQVGELSQVIVTVSMALVSIGSVIEQVVKQGKPPDDKVKVSLN